MMQKEGLLAAVPLCGIASLPQPLAPGWTKAVSYQYLTYLILCCMRLDLEQDFNGIVPQMAINNLPPGFGV